MVSLDSGKSRGPSGSRLPLFGARGEVFNQVFGRDDLRGKVRSLLI